MKKLFTLLLALAMVVACFAGCGGQKEEAAPASKDNQAAEGEAPAEEIVLSVFDCHAYGLDEYAVMAKAFEDAHPGVKIEVQHAANDGKALLKARVNSGDIPDVFDVESGTNAAPYYAYAYEWTNDTDVLDKFNPAALKSGTTEDGKVMSLPWTYENMGLIYNKDCFAKAGIDTVPTTLTELEAACEKLQAAGITPITLASKETWVLMQTATHFMMDKSIDAKGVADKINAGELKVGETKNWNNLFRFLDLAVKYGPNKPLEVDWETCENKLANGETAIIHMGDWCQATLDSFNPDANLGFMPFPVSDDPADTTLLSNCNWTYIVNKDSKHLELAKEYAEFILSSQEGQTWMCDGVGAVPGAKIDREVKGALANEAAGYVAEGKTNGWIHTLMPDGYVDMIGPAIQGYIAGDMTAEEVTQIAEDSWIVN